MSNKNNRPKGDIQKQLEALGFERSRPTPKTKSAPNQSRKRNHKNNKRKEIERKQKLDLKKLLEKTYNLVLRNNITLEELKTLRSQLKKEPKIDHEKDNKHLLTGSPYSPTNYKRTFPNTSTHGSLGIGDYDKFKFLELTSKSRINPEFLKDIKFEKTCVTSVSSNKTQRYPNSKDGVDLVMGIDFGTTNTKVVIQETGSGKSWAIPFNDRNTNQYLMPSTVFLKEGIYSLNGDSSHRIGNLKLPLIEGSISNTHLVHVIAFLALVIRHARLWFLEDAATAFYDNNFEWFYKMGLPAENNDNKGLVATYKSTLSNAVKLSLADINQIYLHEVDHMLSLDVAHSISDYCDVHPEIQAQLEGYTKSDRWDSRRVKVMMVDIGGGTVDASIINVTRRDDEEQYSCLNTKVESLGVYILHQKRLEWLEMSINKSSYSTDELKKEIDQAKKVSGNLPFFPETIEDYISNANWPKDFSYDQVFYNAFYDLIYFDIISEVRSRIDTRNAEQWNNLCFILCGGGSLHPLFSKIASDQKLDVVRLQKPSSLNAAITDNEYHRISVAYGLSFMEQGWFINPSDIAPMDNGANNQPNWQSNFIDKDMM